jgi:hypothetical protein
MDGYLEVGAKRVFAGALEWPGWCRSGRNEDAALATLLAYGERYASVVDGDVGGFHIPVAVSELQLVERLTGDATTDFGAPSIAPAADARPVDVRGLRRLQAILDACWAALDRAVSKGPRGGGRELEAIVAHVVGAETGYLRHIAARSPVAEDELVGAAAVVRDTVRAALADAVKEGLPAAGPRGGRIWSVRYFVRRTAWHALDHAWEIEDRRV